MAVEGEALLLEGDTVVVVVVAAVVVVVAVAAAVVAAGMVDARNRITEAFWFGTFRLIAGSVFLYHCCHLVCVSV
jgi:hypothetical protein